MNTHQHTTTLQQVVNIINPNTNIIYDQSLKKTKNNCNIISTKEQQQQHQLHDQLQHDLLKNQLSTCLYGLKQFSQKLKKQTYNQFKDSLQQYDQEEKKLIKENNNDSKKKAFNLNNRKQYKLPTISSSQSNSHFNRALNTSPNQQKILTTKIYNQSRLNNISNTVNNHLSQMSVFQKQRLSRQVRFSFIPQEHTQQSHVQYSSFILNHQNGQSLINLSQTGGGMLLGGSFVNNSGSKMTKMQQKERSIMLSRTEGGSFFGGNDRSGKIEEKNDKSQSSISMINIVTKNNLKKKTTHPKQTKHLYQTATNKALPKQHRYFCNTTPKIDSQQITKLGLYQSSNRFRKEFIPQQVIGLLSPTIQKKELGEQIAVCKENELFLTRPKELPQEEMEEFLKDEFAMISDVRDAVGRKENKKKSKLFAQSPQTLSKDINININNTPLSPIHIITSPIQSRTKYQNNDNQQYIQKENNDNNTNDEKDQQIKHVKPCEFFNQQQKSEPTLTLSTITFLQTKNYQIIKNTAYLTFKKQHISIWEEIETLMKQVLQFLKTNNISSWKFKVDNLLNYWSGKKLSIRDIEKILKINHRELKLNKKSAMETLLSIVKAKRKTHAIVKMKANHEACMRWVVDRMKGHLKIRHQTQYKIKKAQQLHQELLKGDYQWQIEIYIASFSENQFIRNTTQYMQSFQNMFAHMWRQSTKEMILVMPTVNAELLQIYQDKIKIKRAITIVCPEVHELFPEKISLAACLLFSYEALNKIKRLIQGKKAVIIPGRFSEQPKYELLISQFLRTPLLSSLKPKKDLQSQKTLFQEAKLSVPSYAYIPPKAGTATIIQKFAFLISQHKESTQWMFKINGEFSGRGLAVFSTKSSKVLRSILSSSKQTLKLLQDYLRRNLYLKLKINYQNSLFMLGDYLERLSQKGGIIQQQKEYAQFYQVSFFIQDKMNSYIMSCYKCFSTNYSNKAYIFQPVANVQISQYLVKLKSVLAMEEYLGYVSVNVMVAGDVVYGLEIKPFMTHLCSAQPFIKAIQARRQLKLNLNKYYDNQQSKQSGTSTLRNDYIVTTLRNKEKQSLKSSQENTKRGKQQNNKLFNNNINTMFIEQLQGQKKTNHLSQQSQFSYLFIPNIVLTDVPLNKKASFIQSLVVETWTKNKFNIFDNNLVLYLSNGLSLNVLIIGKDIGKMRKIGIDTVRMLSQKSSAHKVYCGKNQPRDVFQFGDIIKALTQIKC